MVYYYLLGVFLLFSDFLQLKGSCLRGQKVKTTWRRSFFKNWILNFSIELKIVFKIRQFSFIKSQQLKQNFPNQIILSLRTLFSPIKYKLYNVLNISRTPASLLTCSVPDKQFHFRNVLKFRNLHFRAKAQTVKEKLIFHAAHTLGIKEL